MSKLYCRNCGCIVVGCGRRDGPTYWKHCRGGRSTDKPCRTPQPENLEAERKAFQHALNLKPEVASRPRS